MYTKQELVKDLNILLALEIKDLLSLTEWYNQAKTVVKKIRSSAKLSNNIPEDVWHYLSDADIRFKDNSFKRLQEEKVIIFGKDYYSLK